MLARIDLGAVTTHDIRAVRIAFTGGGLHRGVRMLSSAVILRRPLSGKCFPINVIGCAMFVAHLGLVTPQG